MRILRLFVCIALFLSSAAAQFHAVPGGTKVVCSWGTPVDVEVTKDKFKLVTSWLVKQGAPEAALVMVAGDPIPGCPASPAWPYLEFSKPGFETAVHDYGLVLGSPSVALTELELHFKFGNPFVMKVYSDAPQPANPIGPAVDGRVCLWFTVVGDRLPPGTVHDGKRKVTRGTPFGAQEWWECVSAP